MLYEIKKENGKFKLFFNKKDGIKFKKSFSEYEWAEYFVESYLRHCCLKCLQRGWVYKTRASGGLHGGGNRHGSGNRGIPRWGKPSAGSIVSCPECQAKYQIQYQDWHMILTLHQD